MVPLKPAIPIIPMIAPPLLAATNSPLTVNPASNLTPGSAENSSSAMDQAMAATLAAIEMPTTPQGKNFVLYMQVFYIFVL